MYYRLDEAVEFCNVASEFIPMFGILLVAPELLVVAVAGCGLAVLLPVSAVVP